MDVGSDDSFLKFIGELQSGGCKVADDTVDHHLMHDMLFVGDEITQLPHEVELYIRIVDANGAGEVVAGIVAVDVDVLIWIALVVEVADESLGLDVRSLVVIQLTL